MSIEKLFAFGKKPNIMLIITDQERALSTWPKEDRDKIAPKLKAMQRLQANGLSFEHAHTAASMCSPSRATFQTSQYPIVTACTQTGASMLPSPVTFPNIATVLTAAGYDCFWIGKWHLLWPNEPNDLYPATATSTSLAPWGYLPYEAGGDTFAWDPPDAGITLDGTYLGGGTKENGATNQNDQRYVLDARNFLANAPTNKPWCLVVSLVNPHDSHLGYLGTAHEYYRKSDYKSLGIELPRTVNQKSSTMPRGQSYYSWESRKGTGAQKRHFADFYAYLLEHVDHQVGRILDAMTKELLDETLIIRFSDHGEMGLAHGLVEKFVNAYSQCVRVPLVFSNRKAWPIGETTQALASTVDLVPTLAKLLKAHPGKNSQGEKLPPWSFVGADLTPVLYDPTAEVQSFVHFTYDDESDPKYPSVIRAIRSREWAYAVYMHAVSSATSGYRDADWEMYDLRSDAEERVNLAGKGMAAQEVIDGLLQIEMILKNTAPAWYEGYWPPRKSRNSIGGPPPSGGSTGSAIASLPGMTDRHLDALAGIGVHNIADLLARTATSAHREALVKLAKVKQREIDGWIAGALQLLEHRPAKKAARRAKSSRSRATA